MRPHNKVVRIHSARGDYCLKPVVKSPNRLGFMHRVQEHVRGQGFGRLGFLVPTTQGQTAAWRDGLAWTLSEWIPGRELDYQQTWEVALGAEVLAGFHLASEDFPAPAPVRSTSNLGKWPAKVASRCGELLCCANAPRHNAGNGFQAALAAQAVRLAEHAQRSLLILNESGYAEYSRSATGVMPICHGDPAAHNLILSPDGTVALIDLNSLRADLPCVDLWKLLHRTGFRRNWAPGALTEVLQSYCQVRELGDLEATVLLGLLWFPEKQWRLAYNAGRQPVISGSDSDWDDESSPELAVTERMTLEMTQAGQALPAKEACLKQLERHLVGKPPPGPQAEPTGQESTPSGEL